MNLITASCVEYSDNRAKCTAEKNKMVYKLHNKSGHNIKKINVDFLDMPGKKCDYIFSIESTSGKAIFVELKGKKTNIAVEQLLATVNRLFAEFNGKKIAARIVGTGTAPDFIQTKSYINLAKLTNRDIIIRTNELKETI